MINLIYKLLKEAGSKGILLTLLQEFTSELPG